MFLNKINDLNIALEDINSNVPKDNIQNNGFKNILSQDAFTLFLQEDTNDINYYCNKYNLFDILITDTIEYDTNTYKLLIQLLKSVNKKHTVNLYINSGGGFVNCGLYICDLIRQSEAQINGIVNTLAASMAALIFSYCDNLICDDQAIIMFHDISSGYYGKITEISKKLDNISDLRDRSFKIVLEKKLLTSSEYQDLVNGKDIYLSGATIKKRIKGEDNE